MSADKRRVPRKFLKYPARIEAGDGTVLRECLLADISQSGARIKIKPGDSLPNRFTLLLGSPSGARRQCRVVWRRGDEIGVEFNKEPPAKARQPRSQYRDR
jgi:hypothetical protein